jgi:hypothetical protein
MWASCWLKGKMLEAQGPVGFILPIIFRVALAALFFWNSVQGETSMIGTSISNLV